MEARTILVMSAIVAVAPSFAPAAPTLTELSFSTSEISAQSDEVWDPFDWMGFTGAGNDDGFMKRSDGAKIISKASTMSYMNPLALWMIGSSTTAADMWKWRGLYELTGDEGQRASVTMEYTLDSWYVNNAFDGYSGGVSWADWSYNRDGLAHPYRVDFKKDFYGAAFTYGDDTKTGTIEFGEMDVGDRLRFEGSVFAGVKTTHYYAGFVTAAMVSSFEYTLRVTELPPDPKPIPAPGALSLLGAGLIGLGGLRRKLGAMWGN